MTGTAISYTTPAATRLDDYLRAVRAALGGLPDVSPDEVEADTRAHVEAELAGAPLPIKLADLEVVLSALGPPSAWWPAGSPRPGFTWPALRDWLVGVGRAIYGGPEDWRLAYLCLILTVLAPLTAGLSLLVAYLLGRAAAELARERGELLGARRWLIYPAIVAVSVPLIVAAVAVPLGTAPLVFGVFVEPAETYREYVESVDANGAVRFRHGTPASSKSTHREVYRLYDAGIRDTVDDTKRVTWHVTESSRAIHERTIGVMDRIPVPKSLAGPMLAAFATLGVALAWWALLGTDPPGVPGGDCRDSVSPIDAEAAGVVVGDGGRRGAVRGVARGRVGAGGVIAPHSRRGGLR